MKTAPVSTIGFTNAPRQTIEQTRVALKGAQIEVSSGRLADVGRSLGTGTAEAVRLRQNQTDINALRDSNQMLETHLATMQLGLDQIVESAQTFLSELVSAHGDVVDRGVLIQSAREKVDQLTALASSSVNGAHVFGGTTTDQPPLRDYLDTASATPSAGRAAVDATFVSEFGFSADTPSVATISASQMTTFLDGAFASVFDDNASWLANFSNTAGDPRTARVSQGEVISITTTANEDGMRQLVKAYVTIIDLGAEELNGDAYVALVDGAMSAVGSSVSQLNDQRSEIGFVEERLAATQSALELQSNLLTTRLSQLEGVDEFEAASRLNSLLVQLETSYAVTARVRNLSLLNYL